MSRTSNWAVARPILERLLALPAEQRATALTRECAGDRRLHAQLERLLRAAEQRLDAFEPARLDRIDGEELTASSRAIGPWRLVRALGAGGMGDVWLVEREGADFRQRAALKLVKRGMDTEAVLARFRRERKVLAELTHPAIPSLIDGGASDDGRPYVVMEYVDGEPLDQFVHTHSLDIGARLRLFVAICDAVQHAHERGVVHRDLKPSNVLVTSAGEPKLLDFGISKVLDAREDSQTIDLTQTGQHMLTPRYASPEQVLGREVTAAADVYALGLMLWELLVGRPAVSLDGLSQSEWIETICERDVPRPSASLDANATSHKRAITGDLDTICAMALRKEPARRYASVKQLADDVRRHLDAQPVLARADTVTYRVSKFVRRNRLLVGATFGIVVALATGLAIAVVMYLRSENARRLAAKRLEDAEYFAYQSALRGAYSDIQSGVALPDLYAQSTDLRGWEWRHLIARSDCTKRILWRAPGMSSLAIDDAGSTLAFSEWNDVVLLDIESGEPRRVIPTREPPFKLALSFDAGLVAHACGVQLTLLNGATGEPIWVHDSAVKIQSVKFSRDGRRVLLGLVNGELLSLAVECPTPNVRLARLRGSIYDIVVSKDGALLAASAGSDDVAVLRARDGAILHRYRRTDRPRQLYGVALSSTGRYVASVDDDGQSAIWDTTTDQALALPADNGQYCLALGMRSDRDELVIPGNHLRVWDFASGASRSLPGGQTTIRRMVMHPTLPLAYTSSSDGRIFEWDVSTRQVPTLETGVSAHAIAVRPDRTRIALCNTGTERVHLVDAATGAILATHQSKSALAGCVAFAPDGTTVVASDSRGLLFLDGETLAPSRRIELSKVDAFAVAADAPIAYVHCSGDRVVQVNLATEQIEGHVALEQATALACDPSGAWVAAADASRGAVSVLRWGTNAWRTISRDLEGRVRSLAVSPDCRWVATCCDGLRVQALDSGEVVYESLGHVCLASVFTRDSERLIATNSSRLEVIHTRRWSVVMTLGDHERGINALAYDRSTENLYTCDGAETVRLFRASAAPRLDAER